MFKKKKRKKNFSIHDIKESQLNGGVPGGISRCCVVWVACGMESMYTLTIKAVVKSHDQPRRTLQKHLEFINYLIFELIFGCVESFTVANFCMNPTFS